MVNTNTITMYFFNLFKNSWKLCGSSIFNSLRAEFLKWNLPVDDLDLSILVINK